jgi:ribosomal protein L37AE/L43A
MTNQAHPGKVLAMSVDLSSVTVWICQDCIMKLANDENPTEPTEYRPLSNIVGDDVSIALGADVHDGCPRDSQHDECDCEHIPFSIAQCDGCCSPLAGDRYAATMFYRA